MREVELKSVVPDPVGCRRTIESHGARLMFEGRLDDTRYDRPDGTLRDRDEVLRLRVYRASTGEVSGQVDRKGPTIHEDGYKVREETSSPVDDPDRAAAELVSDGFIVVREISRVIAQYELCGATVRLEQYPRMDTLVEVEGKPAEIEEAIRLMDLPRPGFSADRLADFVQRFEARTGVRAAISAAELAGDYRYSASGG